jgi:hypothetical protein
LDKKMAYQTKWSKISYVDFTNKKIQYIAVTINDNRIRHSKTAKYLGMTLDAKLWWKVHIKQKREELGVK